MPEDRRDEEDELDQAPDHGGHVAVTGADQPQQQAYPDPVQHDQRQPEEEAKQRNRARPLREDEHDDHHDHHVVQEHEDVAPHHAEGVHGEGQADLLDHRLAADEGLAALDHQARDQRPGHDARGEEREVLLQVHLEQRRVDEAERDQHDGRADRQPEGAEQGAAELLADVVPAQQQPQVAAREALADVLERELELRFGVKTHERRGFYSMERARRRPTSSSRRTNFASDQALSASAANKPMPPSRRRIQ